HQIQILLWNLVQHTAAHGFDDLFDFFSFFVLFFVFQTHDDLMASKGLDDAQQQRDQNRQYPGSHLRPPPLNSFRPTSGVSAENCEDFRFFSFSSCGSFEEKVPNMNELECGNTPPNGFAQK